MSKCANLTQQHFFTAFCWGLWEIRKNVSRPGNPCAEGLWKVLKVPLCVNGVIWAGGHWNFLKKFPLCVGGVLCAVGLWNIFKKVPPGPCAGGLWNIFKKVPPVCGWWALYWRLWNENFCKKSMCYIGTLHVHFCTEICSAFFDGTCSFFTFSNGTETFFVFADRAL